MKLTPTQLSSRNEAVQTAYLAMLKVARNQLALIERDELRYTLYRDEKPKRPGIIHEFVNPLLYLRLTWHEDNSYGIHYGFEPCKTYERITGPFVRSVYKLSMQGNTEHNIEKSIRTDWFIHNPDDMYQYIEEHNKYHTFKLIKYKQPSVRRKQMQAVA